MKVKVLKRYVDRYTKEIREVDTMHEYGEVRARELIRGGYVEEVKDQRPKPSQGRKVKG